MTTLTYPCGAPPDPGCAREVADGIYWLRMPLSSVLNHINLWLLRDDVPGDPASRWTLVDTGMKTPETEIAWEQAFAAQPMAPQSKLSRIVVTHMHPDHVGMAGALSRKYDCRLWMTRLEYFNCRLLAADTGREAPDEAIQFYRSAAWSEDEIQQYRSRFGGFGRMISRLPDSYHRMEDGDILKIGNYDWQVVVGRGHSPEHACLYCAQLGLFIAGDQVLPKISSNVSVFPTEPDADPLSDWLDSIAKIRKTVPDSVLVLPAHNEPFRGLHARLDQLEEGHRLALERLEKHLSTPRTVKEVFEVLFKRPITSEPMLLGFATGESLAHLNYLVRRGRVVKTAGEDGVSVFSLPHQN